MIAAIDFHKAGECAILTHQMKPILQSDRANSMKVSIKKPPKIGPIIGRKVNAFYFA